MRILKLYIVSLALFLAAHLSAQSSYTSSQWSRYKVSQNIAYAGYYDYLSLGVLHKSQWVGWENAPTWQELVIQSPLKSQSSAMSVTYNLENYPTKNHTHKVKLGYTYILRMPAFNTAFGVGLGFNQRSNNVLNTRDLGDPAFSEEKTSYTIPQASFGVAFYNDKFHAGFSIPEFFGSKVTDEGEFTLDPNYSELVYKITGGYNWELAAGGIEAEMNSNAMVVYSPASVTQFDINTIATVNNMIIGGLGFRTIEAVYLLMGYKVNRQFSVAYSYDFNIGKINNGLKGSHIVGLVYDLNYLVNTANPRSF